MTPTFYLPRRLSGAGRTYSEEELIAGFKYAVVLAEPGGGKTELLRSLASQLNTTTVTATKFGYAGAKEKHVPLVIDAFDELAKIDLTGIYKLLKEAERTEPTHLYLSSRSSEWDEAATRAFTEFIGTSPLIVRLSEFNRAEQQQIFENHLEGQSFQSFSAEVARFDLESLLPNPQFLKLFADAYIESGRHFKDKRSIFSSAVERLAKEANTDLVRASSSLSTHEKVVLASEVFAKLLLSGAEGVSVTAAQEDRIFPLLSSLANHDAINDILSTRLFKPGDSVGQHRAAHKIVAEYCAASYLTTQIIDPTKPLTLNNCLSVIAPNATVRDELRGLLGWMASLGNKSIQEAAIKLDPYTVLANGDPSQLEPSSKRLLITQLKKAEADDPYFRREDRWRKFSAGEFFTPGVIDEVKPLLAHKSGGHLRGLLLELLVGSPAVSQLNDELRDIMLSPETSEHIRDLAAECLLGVNTEQRNDLDILLQESSLTSLSIAARIIETLGPETFGQGYLSNFFRLCAKLYPSNRQEYERRPGGRYFIKLFIANLDLKIIETCLDELTANLACVCNEENYSCYCRNGVSKIVGSMLDRYFELAQPPFDPKRVWQWLKDLNFHEHVSAMQSRAVNVLQHNDELRQGIIAHVFQALTDSDEIFKVKHNKFEWHAHSGLNFQNKDYQFIVDLAFNRGNVGLWKTFIAYHQINQQEKDRGPNHLRSHMRIQALSKPELMRIWVSANKAWAQTVAKHHRFAVSRRRKRRMRNQIEHETAIRSKNIEFIRENRELVESGRHWNCLFRFAELSLMEPDVIQRECGDENLVRNALLNALDFIVPTVPELPELAKLACTSGTSSHIMIIHAACLEIMRESNNLEGVDLRLLKALRTEVNISYPGVSQEQRDALKAEVERLIFSNAESAEDFIRGYIEPQLDLADCQHPKLGILQDADQLSHLRASLSIEWLERFEQVSFGTLDSLFEMAARFGDREELKNIIKTRCSKFLTPLAKPLDIEITAQEQSFWLLRAWYFLDDDTQGYWKLLKEDKDTVPIFYEQSHQRLFRDRSYWPKLTPSKIEAILDAFVDQWPKVDLSSGSRNDRTNEQKAYQFFMEIVWNLNSLDCDDVLPVIERLLTDLRYANFHLDLRSIHSNQLRKTALINFEPPTPTEIVALLDHDAVVTVEGLRQLVFQELEDYQNAISGGEFNPGDRFYEKKKRLGEVRCTEIIAERLNLKLQPQQIIVTIEHQLKDAKRSDFTAAKLINGKRRLLVTEVKGQWNAELYTAAYKQLSERYSIHPEAEQQGIFLVIWFGKDEKVAGLKNQDIQNAAQLKDKIEENMPPHLHGLIDIFVLDVSKK